MILHWRGLHWQSFLSPTIIGNASLSQKIFLTCMLIGWWYNDLCECLKTHCDYISKAVGWLVFPCLMSDNNWGPLSFICSCVMPTPIVDYDRPFFNKKNRLPIHYYYYYFWSKIQWTEWSYCYLLLELT